MSTGDKTLILVLMITFAAAIVINYLDLTEEPQHCPSVYCFEGVTR